MKPLFRHLPALVCAGVFMMAGDRQTNPLLAQSPSIVGRDRDDIRLPNGKLQKEEMLKREHQQNLKDAAKLVELSEELKQDLEENEHYVLSIDTLKKTDEIEKLVKKIRSRLRR